VQRHAEGIAAVPLQHELVPRALHVGVVTGMADNDVPTAKFWIVPTPQILLETSQLFETHCGSEVREPAQFASSGAPDYAIAASGATIEETIGNATTDANPTFLITSLLENPAKCWFNSSLSSSNPSLLN